MDNIANVERRIAVVGFDADDAGGPVIGAAHAALIQQINGIASHLGVGVCRQKTQASRKPLFRLGLKSMVVTAACRGRQITLAREIGEWNHALCVPVRGQDLQDVVVLREYLQMACKGCYIASLDRQRRSDGILQSKVTLHGIGCVVVELNALKGQSLCVYSERIGRSAGKACFEDCGPARTCRGADASRRTREYERFTVVGRIKLELENEGIVQTFVRRKSAVLESVKKDSESAPGYKVRSDLIGEAEAWGKVRIL